MAATTTPKMPGTPKPWMNTAMRTMMRLPGLRILLGRAFALITVTGARTGKRYSTPVQYVLVDGDYVVLSQQKRVWWRNVRTQPHVTLEIRGKTLRGQAHIAEGEDAHRVLSSVLTHNPRIARFYGIESDESGTIDPDAIHQLGERLVAIVISPD